VKEQRNPASIHAPLGAYAHQIEVGSDERLLFMAGQVGMTLEGEIPEGTAEQLELALENVLRNLAAAGMDASDLVKLVFYYAEPIDLARRREIVDARLGGATPCMTLLVVAGLASPQLKVEIDAWASASA